ncbi:MAG: helix-turn-helix transcriptional regulator, partial [Clostridia bacterium]|nr:helix-turn-helix transcriptional regulator [Clostridia bacterium]
ERVLELSKDKNFSQRDIATCIGVTQGTVQKWLAKNRPFSAEYILPLSELFGVSPLFLLTGEEEPAVAKATAGSEAMNDVECGLLEGFRQLDEEGQIVMRAKLIEELRRVRERNGGIDA